MNEETEPKQKQHLVVDVMADGNKFFCCKEQYCIGTWNVRSMNQGKLKLEPIIQSEVSQKEKHEYSILTHINGI